MDNDTTAETGPNDPKPSVLDLTHEHGTYAMIAALPLPRPNTAQARTARNVNAIAQVASLVPVNAAEFMVSVQFVATNAQGLECQRQAQDLDEIEARRAIQLAATMFRVSHGAARVLLRLQAARMQREATQESANSAILSEHCTMQLMAKALAKHEAAQAEARAEADRKAAEEAEAEAARQAMPPPPPPEPAPITAEDIAAAEAFAQSNPTNTNRARILRRKHGMPNWGMFTPPEDNVVNAIAFGHSPVLDALLPELG